MSDVISDRARGFRKRLAHANNRHELSKASARFKSRGYTMNAADVEALEAEREERLAEAKQAMMRRMGYTKQ